MKKIFNSIYSVFLFIILFSCKSTPSREDQIKALNPTKESQGISYAELATNFESYKNKLVVIEGIVSSNCCGQRVTPLIDIDEYIFDNGDVVNPALNFKKEDLEKVHQYSKGMKIKVYGYVEKLRKSNIPETNGNEYYITINDCVIL
jgi:hypothetical protein